MKIIDTNINNKEKNNDLIEKNNVKINKILGKIKKDKNNLFSEYVNIIEKIANWNKLNSVIIKGNITWFGEDLISDYNIEEDNDTDKFIKNIKKFERLELSIPIIYSNYGDVYVVSKQIFIITREWYEFVISFLNEYEYKNIENFDSYLKNNYSNIIIVNTDNIEEIIIKMWDYFQNNMNIFWLETLFFSTLNENLLYLLSNEFDNEEDYIISINNKDSNKIAETFSKEESRSLWNYVIDTNNEIIKQEAKEKSNTPVIVYSFISSSYNNIKVLNRTSNCVLKIKEFKELKEKLLSIFEKCN